MKTLYRFALVASLACGIAVALSTASEAKGKCVLAGGQATMVTAELAKFMAEAALKNSISGMGAKAVGKPAVTCKYDLVLSSCTARQRACK